MKIKEKIEKVVAKLFWLGVIPETRANKTLKEVLVFRHYTSKQSQKQLLSIINALPETEAAFRAAVIASQQVAARFGIPTPKIRIYAYHKFKYGRENGFYTRSHPGTIFINVCAFMNEGAVVSVANTAAHETAHYWQHLAGKRFPDEMPEAEKELWRNVARKRYKYSEETVEQEAYAIFVGENWRSM